MSVEPIRKDATEVEPVFPGVECALAQMIDDKRSLSLKTMFLQKTHPREHERVMASLFCVTAVIALREKVIEFRREQQNAEQRLSEIQVDPAKRDEIKDAISALELEATNFAQAEEQKFRTSGRSGSFMLQGSAKTRAQGYVTDIERRKSELASLDADTKRQSDELQKAIKNWSIAIENAEREIAIRREAYGD